jgi:hypothetical protein
LERLDPFPTEANFKKMKAHLENYATSLEKLKEDLKTRVLPAAPIAPNEFQSRLRQAMVAIAERARANKVKIPDNFALGFEDYTAALPSTAAAPLLGQELAQVQMLLNMLVDARVDELKALSRVPLTEERAPAAAPASNAPGARKTPAPSGGPTMLERGIVNITFTSAPSAARKVLNQLGSSSQQFYITRALNVRNDKDKGPVREQPAAGAAATPLPPGGKAAPALSFIVGNEHIETSARIEIVRFTF